MYEKEDGLGPAGGASVAVEEEGAQRPFDERRLFVVVNPRAANGDVGARWEELRSLLEEVLGPFEFAMTDSPMAATRLATDALRRGFDLVASLGGDGTHNETLNGFFEGRRVINPEAALAILPFGTGGDFRKTIGLGGDMREAAIRIGDGAPRLLDVGRVDYIDHRDAPASRYFLNVASFGISGLIDQKVNESTKMLGGKATFMIGFVRALGEYEAQRVRLLIDDGIDVEASINNVAVANGRYFGGGMKVAPYAKIDDGLFDVVIVREMNLPEVFSSGVKIYGGRHLESAHISHLQARRLSAAPLVETEVVLLDIDGEAPGRLPASFEILPGAVQIWG